MSAPQPLNIIIIEKEGKIKSLSIKDFKLSELYKKCGFKKDTHFIKQAEWKVQVSDLDINNASIIVYGKTDGRANSENKYEFPPPIDSKLFFGNCAVLCYSKTNSTYVNLTIKMWEKIYEKLFGGFENLGSCNDDDDNELDELANIPKKFKTKDGYLNDGFVVDDEIESVQSEQTTEPELDTNDNDNDSAEENIIINVTPKIKPVIVAKSAKTVKSILDDSSDIINDSDSELSEEDYTY